MYINTGTRVTKIRKYEINLKSNIDKHTSIGVYYKLNLGKI